MLRNPSRIHSLMGDLAFGVCDLTLPARARDPCTFPMVSKSGVGARSGGSGGVSALKSREHTCVRDDLLKIEWRSAAASMDMILIVGEVQKIFVGESRLCGIIGTDKLFSR